MGDFHKLSARSQYKYLELTGAVPSRPAPSLAYHDCGCDPRLSMASARSPGVQVRKHKWNGYHALDPSPFYSRIVPYPCEHKAPFAPPCFPSESASAQHMGSCSVAFPSTASPLDEDDIRQRLQLRLQSIRQAANASARRSAEATTNSAPTKAESETAIVAAEPSDPCTMASDSPVKLGYNGDADSLTESAWCCHWLRHCSFSHRATRTARKLDKG